MKYLQQSSYFPRFADRDMLVRHMWGHGVGHVYSHSDAPCAAEPDVDMAEPAAMGDEPDLDPGNDGEDFELRPDTLEDLENEELDLYCSSEEETSDDEGRMPEPDDEFPEDERW
jgi:hypothetical protein